MFAVSNHNKQLIDVLLIISDLLCVLIVTAFRLRNKRGFMSMNFVYWVDSFICMFHFMTGSMFTWRLHRLIYDMFYIQRL